MVNCFMGPMKMEFNEGTPQFDHWYNDYKKLGPKFEDNPQRDLKMMCTGSLYIDLYEDGEYIGSAEGKRSILLTEPQPGTDDEELAF